MRVNINQLEENLEHLKAQYQEQMELLYELKASSKRKNDESDRSKRTKRK
jgi:hypothetical protein